MVASAPALHDIHDPSAFVHATINRARLHLSHDEREELHAEGLAILYDLASKYRPRIDGHERDESRFSGYAAQFLPRKLGDAWHRLHPEHQLVNDPATGKRRWEYRDRAVSLEAITHDTERQALLADRAERVDLRNRLHAALFERWTNRVKLVVEVGGLLSEGASVADCAQILGVTTQLVRDALTEIEMVADRIRSDDS